jgi:GNAT superfamily N-acetyltransferase
MELRVRPAAQAIAGAISTLIRSLRLFRRLEEQDLETTDFQVARHLAMCLSDESHLVLVAELPGGDLVGYGSIHWLPYVILGGPEGYVSELFVAERHRGAGVGSALLRAMIGEGEATGLFPSDARGCKEPRFLPTWFLHPAWVGGASRCGQHDLRAVGLELFNLTFGACMSEGPS